ncbi:conjugal transfer protein TrbJ [Sphingopyxis sp. Root1497]|uniref:P-type conjugative transfer protein TrbJ n=1 Tax=Sphingopyxis sp. Root1497 TaxID=1736474 RepID=UPI0006F41C2C|nr:P-type conjugative transfer protein TrbJ [Sphingopyxis sp. Root1497]KQZ62041.1 conjugal transfer protein TrbJ [Sphingopyxis sp. Root1497]
MTKRFYAAFMLGMAAATSISFAPPAAAMPVFDSANYSQNLLTAARTLQQINQQITSLQNEAQMLVNMDKHLRRVDFPELEALKGNLLEVVELMKQGDSIGFDAAAMEARLGALFPRDLRLGDRAGQVADAKARLDAAMASFRQSMAVQSQIVANVREDAKVLADLAARSNGAEGSLQVAQATNQLLALAAKQQLQLQSMMAAEYRAASLDRARAAQSAAEARARTKRFLGDGKAYTPQPR